MKKMTLNAIAVMLLASLSTFSIAAVPDSNPAAHSGHQHGANEQSASLGQGG
jgi:Spy/CpxP family protein refolding chaperone